jgi:hypothetical protein
MLKKKEIKSALINYTKLKYQESNTESEKYILGLVANLKFDTKKTNYIFLKELSKISECSKFPLINYKLIKTYHLAWKRDKLIFSKLLYLHKLISIPASEIFIKSFVVYLTNYSENKKLTNKITTKIKLIAKLYNINCNDPDIIIYAFDGISNYEFTKNDQKNLSNETNYTISNRLNLIFYWNKKMIDENIRPFNIGFMLSNYIIDNGEFLLTSEEFFNENNNLDPFIKLLESKLPPNYPCRIQFNDLKKLYIIYTIRPSLFDNLIGINDNSCQIDYIFKNIFLNFDISSDLKNKFIKGELSKEQLEWFKWILSGKNLSKAPFLPFKITKKAAHIFNSLDNWFNIDLDRKLVFASFISLGIEEDIALRIATNIPNINHTNFWLNNLPILIKKGLKQSQIIPVIQYLNFKMLNQKINLNLKSTKIQNLIRKVKEFKLQINKTSCKLSDLKIPDFKIYYNGNTYLIEQLRYKFDLKQEGKIMKHCVYSYKWNCFIGISHIFSLKQVVSKSYNINLLTIHYSNGRIQEIRGKFNREPIDEEMQIVNKWIEKNNIHLAA